MEITIKTESGIHARPASQIVNTSQKFKSEVIFIKDGNEFNAKSIMNIMGMGLQKGDKINLKVKGADSKKAQEEIIKIFDEINNE